MDTTIHLHDAWILLRTIQGSYEYCQHYLFHYINTVLICHVRIE